jgi:Pyruvate/2-oxoacid:ferredoxin oxidoreductase gamma subunit
MMATDMVEIRWHARGGQGAKTAAMFLAEAVLSKGKYGQGFPEYGPERRGAPVRGFTRISAKPIRRHCGIENPGIVIVLDPTLLDSPAAGVTAGTDEESHERLRPDPLRRVRARAAAGVFVPVPRFLSLVSGTAVGRMGGVAA